MIVAHPPHPKGEGAPHGAAVWLDLTDPNEAERSLVEDHAGVRLPTRSELAEIEQSSRLAYRDGVLRLTAPVIAKADTDHPSLSEVGLILTARLLITVRYDHLKSFEAAADKIDAEGPPASGPDAFITLLEAFVDRQADLLEEARARLDQISHRVFRRSTADPLRARLSGGVMRERLQTLGRIGERISMIRESLLAVERMVPFALDSAKDWFAGDLGVRLKGVREDIGSISLFEEHLLGKVQFLLDAVLGFISIEQNDIFKVLTIASVVGIFPTLVVGWYGMNFHNMPEFGWRYGYQFGIAAIVLSTIAPLLWFKWRGWL
ncbi:MAG: magnesium transporter CorA family protein [Caulobacteraceae bacterium]|nr:magnesium transporter CorA family protein [Caulobacteraceae bacterium]